MQPSRAAAVDLHGIPVGAGGHFVSFNGRVFEAIEAARQHRQRCGLDHVALVVELNGDRYTIELAPWPDADEASRGVVARAPWGAATSAGCACFAIALAWEYRFFEREILALLRADPELRAVYAEVYECRLEGGGHYAGSGSAIGGR